jgi:hypothetical protein
MTYSISITFQYINLSTTAERKLAEEALNSSKESSFHQINGERLSTHDLLNALNAFDNENESSDLSLDQLEQITGGVGLPEALVSSTILMAMVAGASGMFVNSVGAVGDSQSQDLINTSIHSNIESVRHQLTNHNYNEATGMYNPQVESGAIGEDFVQSLNLIDINPERSGIQTNLQIGNENIIRTIEADGNGITVTYRHGGNDVQSTSMVAPASGWLS